MKKFIVIILLSGIAYGGWIFYHQLTVKDYSYHNNLSQNIPLLNIQSDGSALGVFESVLGVNISSGVESASKVLNNITGGTSEPIINQAVSNIQSELKTLPEDQLKKFQYNYCKSIIKEYEDEKLTHE